MSPSRGISGSSPGGSFKSRDGYVLSVAYLEFESSAVLRAAEVGFLSQNKKGALVSVLAPSPSLAAICFPLANVIGNGPVCCTWEVSGSKEAVLGLRHGDHVTPAI